MSGPTCHICGRPRLRDVYSGEGGAGRGYQLAGFCVSAVDNSRARLDRYPLDCPAATAVLGDAIEEILTSGHKYPVHHASPPCTGYSRGTAALPDRYERYDRLIAATRAALEEVGGPYVIENVEDAKSEMRNPLTLCAFEFNLTAKDDDGTRVYLKRHRLFESNVLLMGAGGCSGHARSTQVAGVYGGARRDKDEARNVRKGGYVPPNRAVLSTLLGGVDWMSEKGMQLSIPPVYTEHIGRQVLDHIVAVAA